MVPCSRWIQSILLLTILDSSATLSPARSLEPLPEKVVVLTFDDGVRSHFTLVRPLLLELGFSATFFITEGFDFPLNKRDYMSWDQIRTLYEDGFEIGNHTRDHLDVTDASLAKLPRQVEAIQEKCRAKGIPPPISFAWPGNAIHPAALVVLESAGLRLARRGGSPERPYEAGRGVAFEPGRDHPLLIPSAGDARPNWTLADFRAALDTAAVSGTVPVLQFHGVPDRQHPWVSTRPTRFREFMQLLAGENYTVLALRDLERYLDLKATPDDPLAAIRERLSTHLPPPAETPSDQ